MDFYQLVDTVDRKGVTELYPSFRVRGSEDLMIRGGKFYAIWDEEKGMWSTDLSDVTRLIDKDILEAKEALEAKIGQPVRAKFASNFKSGVWKEFLNYVDVMWDNYEELDSRLTFAQDKVTKRDYVSQRLPYSMEPGDISAYEEMVSTLYDPPERAKLEWAVGAVITGDARDIHKFLVLHGPGGSGKSTYLRIVEQLFEGYVSVFDAKSLATSGSTFAAAAFKDNPLVAIQHDGNLSKIEDNTRLNAITSHEPLIIEEKYKSAFSKEINCLLMIGSNSAVQITDAKSGIIRRLIDVKSSGRLVPTARYHILKNQISFELGAIAAHCKAVYESMGKDYYAGYKPLDMMYNTDVMYNFVWENYLQFKNDDGVALHRAYDLYKQYCDGSNIKYTLPMYKFRDELKNYFRSFNERVQVGGERTRSYFSGFILEKFTSRVDEVEDERPLPLVLDKTESVLDDILADQPAQYATKTGIPSKKWSEVESYLKDLDTGQEHYIKVPDDMIVIDFDLKGPDGEKSFERNLEAASKWPMTYAETSKSGKGIHLHYYYKGDPSKLANLYDTDIEVKVFRGDASLRRKVVLCNDHRVETINSGLPFKEDRVIDKDVAMSERGMRELIMRNLRKEIHPGTKPSIDFIKKILDDMYESGKPYDVRDLRTRVLSFAMESTNQSEAAVKTVSQMKFYSDEERFEGISRKSDKVELKDLVFYDIECFPNLFVVVLKPYGQDNLIRLINPTPSEIEKTLDMNLVGFYNRRYDNHMLYGAYLGYSTEQLYSLSQKLISNSANAGFLEAYNLSYLDVWEMSSEKMSLKKWEVTLGIHHLEYEHPWDEPVPEDKIEEVVSYCENDVRATEAVFNARIADYTARLILCELSGLTPNDKTQTHAERIIFGKVKEPQKQFVYTDLSETFPGYTYEFGKSSYRGEDPSEGGYVYEEPGFYENVGLLDIASMHPTSLIAMNYFGDYTPRFKDLLDARLAIKHGDYKTARSMLNGVLESFLTDETQAEALSYALKIIINIVYGMTSASYENKFRDPRNVDNIVAKRGALFMVDLKNYLQDKGTQVVHIKTDSVKIPNITDEIVDDIMAFGKKYGYTFEYEDVYKRFILLNAAVYVAESTKKNKWIATGAQFLHPYLFKAIFSKEEIEFKDLVETKSVQTAMYLDMNETLPEGEHAYKFVGKVGSFLPIQEGAGAGVLYREKEGKYYAVSGTKGYRWMESEMVKTLGLEDKIDMSYYERLVDKGWDALNAFGDAEAFIRER